MNWDSSGHTGAYNQLPIYNSFDILWQFLFFVKCVYLKVHALSSLSSLDSKSSEYKSCIPFLVHLVPGQCPTHNIYQKLFLFHHDIFTAV